MTVIPVAFAASVALTFFAALYPERPPAIVGIVDVGLALSLLIGLMLLRQRVAANVVAEDRNSAYLVVSVLAALPLILLGAFFLGLSIKWHVLLPGLAWRSWYLISALPYLYAARRIHSATARLDPN